jgi:hypothetical protein
MKYLIGIGLILALTFSSSGQNTPVIVELYTSQGCSSCPAADKNLTEILKNAEAAGLPIYGLSFHVDYWNNIGWKDPYSNKEYTERQKMYGEKFHTNGIYTPQIVINGSAEFVGSNKDEINRYIQFSLAQKPKYQLTLSGLERVKGALKFNFEVNGSPDKEFLRVALVERTLGNFVHSGENSGKKLYHDNVVRTFMTIDLKQKGQTEIKLPKSEKKLLLIAFIQDEKGKILAATENPLPESD